MFLEPSPDERARAAVKEISKTVAEHETDDGTKGKMPYRDWRELAIKVIAKEIEEAEDLQRHKAELKRIGYLMLAVGSATVAFWSGVLVIGRILRSLGLGGLPV